MITLINLVLNSNFEQLEYEGDKIKPMNWSNIYTYNHSYSTAFHNDTNTWETIYSPNGILDSKHTYSNGYSLLLDRDFDIIKSDAVKINKLSKHGLIKDHIYYLACYTIAPLSDSNIENEITLQLYRQSASIINITTINEWKRDSIVFTASQNTDNTTICIKQLKELSTNIYIDSILLIDLTETFGVLGEPSKEWCDKNIPYFTDTYKINESKNVEILNIDKFVKNEKNGIYYNNDNNVEIIFSIEDFDLNRNLDISNTKGSGLRYTLTESYLEPSGKYDFEEFNGENRTTKNVYFGDENFNEDNIIDIKDGKTLFKINVECNAKSIGKQLQILGDNALYGETITQFAIFTWRSTHQFLSDNNLTFKFEHIVTKENDGIYDSDYYYMLTGETNPYILAPMEINLYVNDTKIPGIEYEINQFDKCKFKKDVFLVDGENTVVLEAVDILGNKIIKNINDPITNSSIININILPDEPDNYDLITNFIGNDDYMIELKMDKARLEYQDKNAGREKILDLDTSVASHFFTLEGINSEYYRLSRENVPHAISDIIPKPLVVNFSGVEKEYDGNADITDIFYQNITENSFSYLPISEQYTSYLSTGFVKGTYEYLFINDIIFKQDDILPATYYIHANNVDINSVVIDIDGHIGIPNNDGEIIFETITNKAKAIKQIDKISESDDEITLLYLLQNKDSIEIDSDKYYYCIYEMTKADKSMVYTGYALHIYKNENDNIIFNSYEIMGESNTIDVYNNLKTKLINWLKAIDNVIYEAKVYTNELNETYIDFLFNDSLQYTVKNYISIKYNYKDKLTNDSKITFETSDEGKVIPAYTTAYFDNKDVSDSWKPISLSNIHLIGEEAKNYQLANYSAYGRIVKRGLNIHLRCLNKVYDGTSHIPFELDRKYYNGLENSIIGDDVYIDDTYYEDPTSQFHTFKKIGPSYITVENSSAGDNKLIITPKHLTLEGKDSHNYYINNILCYNQYVSIVKRKVEVVIDKLRYIRSTSRWEIDYHFINDLPHDNLTLAFNLNTQYDFKVYGGKYISSDINKIYEIADIDSNLLNDYNDIIKMFFNYKFDYNYKFNEQHVETCNIGNTDKFYWTNDARKAEPNTERIDIDIEIDKNYPGEIKLSKSDLPYFESQDKAYRLYNNHKVKITNINLDPQNPISNNYELINNTFITMIEII